MMCLGFSCGTLSDRNVVFQGVFPVTSLCLTTMTRWVQLGPNGRDLTEKQYGRNLQRHRYWTWEHGLDAALIGPIGSPEPAVQYLQEPVIRTRPLHFDNFQLEKRKNIKSDSFIHVWALANFISSRETDHEVLDDDERNKCEKQYADQAMDQNFNTQACEVTQEFTQQLCGTGHHDRQSQEVSFEQNAPRQSRS